MAYVKHKIGMMVDIAPDAAKKKILKVYRDTGCNMSETAEMLVCNAKTLHRWIMKLGIRDEMKKLEEKSLAEGWHHGRRGGAGYHRDPGERVRKARETIEAKRAARGEEEGSS